MRAGECVKEGYVCRNVVQVRWEVACTEFVHGVGYGGREEEGEDVDGGFRVRGVGFVVGVWGASVGGGVFGQGLCCQFLGWIC